MSERTWNNQFQIDEDRQLIVPTWLLRKPWEDHSWGNEVCPRFVNPDLGVSLWVDYDQQEDRELDHLDCKKFTLVQVLNLDEDVLSDTTLFATDSEADLLMYLRTYAIGLHSTAVLDGLTALLDLCNCDEETDLVRGMLDDLALFTVLSAE